MRPCDSGRDCPRAKSGFSFRVLVGARVEISNWMRASAKYPYAIEFSDQHFEDEMIEICLDSECRTVRSNHSRNFISSWGPVVKNVGAWPLSDAAEYEQGRADYNQPYRRHTVLNSCTDAMCATLARQSSSVSYSTECVNDPALPRCGVLANGILYSCCRNERDSDDFVVVSIRLVSGAFVFEPQTMSVNANATIKIINEYGQHPLFYNDDGVVFTAQDFSTTLTSPFSENAKTHRRVSCQFHSSMHLDIHRLSPFQN